MREIIVKTQSEFDAIGDQDELIIVKLQCKIKSINNTPKNVLFHASGNCVIESASENCVIKSASGNCVIESASGNCVIKSAYGNCVIESASGNCVIESASENCVIKSAYGNCVIESAYGNCVIESASENCVIKYASGNCVIKYASGNCVIKSAYGNCVIESASGNCVTRFYSGKINKISCQAVIYNNYSENKIDCIVKNDAQIIDVKQYDYFTRHDIDVIDGKYKLYKRVSKDFKTQENTEHETLWIIGSTVTHPKYRPETSECGVYKFHACASPLFCNQFRNDYKDDKYICIEVAIADTYEWPKPDYPHKIAFKTCKVLYECDEDGKEINQEKA